MTEEQQAAWFTYHAPNEETAPKYAAIRQREMNTYNSILQGRYENLAPPSMHSLINHETQRFAILIRDLCPDCSDRAAAIAHVRLARHAFNEWIVEEGKPVLTVSRDLLRMASDELLKARWKANSAIACNGL